MPRHALPIAAECESEAVLAVRATVTSSATATVSCPDSAIRPATFRAWDEKIVDDAVCAVTSRARRRAPS